MFEISTFVDDHFHRTLPLPLTKENPVEKKVIEPEEKPLTPPRKLTYVSCFSLLSFCFDLIRLD